MTTQNNNRIFQYIAGAAFVLEAIRHIISIIFLFVNNRQYSISYVPDFVGIIGFALIAVSCFTSRLKIMTAGSFILAAQQIYFLISGIISRNFKINLLLYFCFYILFILYSLVDKHAMKFAFAAVPVYILCAVVRCAEILYFYAEIYAENLGFYEVIASIIPYIPLLIGTIMLAFCKKPVKNIQAYPSQTTAVNEKEGVSNTIENLEKLSHLLDIGAISQDEFEKKKAKILDNQ